MRDLTTVRRRVLQARIAFQVARATYWRLDRQAHQPVPADRDRR